jgi:hypothetical protein
MARPLERDWTQQIEVRDIVKMISMWVRHNNFVKTVNPEIVIKVSQRAELAATTAGSTHSKIVHDVLSIRCPNVSG